MSRKMMSFLPSLWRTSKLEQMLESQTEFTLELLDQEDILEEARLMNEKLIKILSTKKAISTMLDHMLNGPLPASQGLPNPNRYSAVSCELFQLGISSVLATIFDNADEILGQYFDFLKRPAPLPSLNAVLFCKTGVMLMERQKQQLFEFIKARKWIIERLLEHITTEPFGDFLLSIIKVDQVEPIGFATLLQECQFLNGIVKQLDGTDDAYQTAVQFLLNLVHVSTYPSVLVSALDSPPVVEKLLEHTLAGLRLPSPLGPGGVDVVTALLKWNVYNVQGLAAAQRVVAGGEGPKEGEELDMSNTLAPCAVLQTVSKRLPDLVRILATPAEVDRRGKRSFGTARLKLLQMLVAYLTTGPHCKPGAFEDFLRQDVPKVLLELLFVYDWNNFVHHLVEEVIRIIVDSTSAELKANLFESAKLTERIVEAFNSKEPKGCLGHLSRVSHNLIINASVQKYLGSEEWQNFTLGKLHHLYKIESAQLGQMDLFELFPELRDELMAQRDGGAGSAEADPEVDMNSSHIMVNLEGDEYQPPKEPQWL